MFSESVYFCFYRYVVSIQRREQRRQDQMSNPHYLKPSSKSATPLRIDEGTGLTSRVDVSNIPVSKLELGMALVIGV